VKRFVLTLAWVLWAHEMATVGDRLVDRGYTAVDSFETGSSATPPWPTTRPSSWSVRAR